MRCFDACTGRRRADELTSASERLQYCTAQYNTALVSIQGCDQEPSVSASERKGAEWRFPAVGPWQKRFLATGPVGMSRNAPIAWLLHRGDDAGQPYRVLLCQHRVQGTCAAWPLAPVSRVTQSKADITNGQYESMANASPPMQPFRRTVRTFRARAVSTVYAFTASCLPPARTSSTVDISHGVAPKAVTTFGPYCTESTR